MEEDIEAELAIIHSQIGYVMQLQGRTEEALQLYNQIIKLKSVFCKHTHAQFLFNKNKPSLLGCLL